MRVLVVEHMRKIKKSVPAIESRIKVKFSFSGERVVIDGAELNEFLAEKIVKAVDFGFDVEDALLLTNEKFILEFLDIKSHTRRKNLKDVRARVIGTDGKAKRAIETLTGSVIVVNENTVGVIVDTEHLDATIQGIESLIQGSKHGNVFSYLEKQNSGRRGNRDDGDLGLKDGISELELDDKSEEDFDEE